MALTDTQKDLMRDTWYEVQLDIKANGEAFYLALFAEHPNFIDYFEKFRGKKLEDLKGSNKLISHAVLAMKNISELIAALDDVEALVGVMHEIVDSHYPRNIVYSHYVKTFDVLLAVLGQALGDQWTPEVKESWSTAFTILLSVSEARLATLESQGEEGVQE